MRPGYSTPSGTGAKYALGVMASHAPPPRFFVSAEYKGVIGRISVSAESKGVEGRICR